MIIITIIIIIIIIIMIIMILLLLLLLTLLPLLLIIIIAISTSFIMKNKLHKKILIKRGRKIEHRGTPNKIYSRELNSEFILLLCFLFDK